MDPIEGISGTRGAPRVPELSNHEPVRGTASAAMSAGLAWRAEAGSTARTGNAPDNGSAGPVRPSPVGTGGRFQKFLLAMQALRLDATPGSDWTQSTKEMRAAVEEIFSIDGVPQAFPSAAMPAPAPFAEAEVKAASIHPPEQPAATSPVRPESAPAMEAPPAPGAGDQQV